MKAHSLVDELIRLQRHQWLPQPKLAEVQARKLRQVVSHAYANVPFYKAMLDFMECKPSDIRSTHDLARLPIVRKADLLKAGRDAFARDVDLSRCVWLTTSGSDGAPARIPFTGYDKARRVLKEIRALMANGFRLTDRMLLVVEPRCVLKNNAWFQRLGFLRRKCLSVYTTPAEQYEWLNQWRPHILYGYTSGLHVLADEIERSQRKVPSLKMVMTSAELLEPGVRRRFEQVFGVPPTDFYGSMEFGWIAWQCPEHSGYHINSDCVIVECLRDGRPVACGEEGEFVITNLHSSAVPLIRYATGDSGTLSSQMCRCGRSLPLISSIRGRLIDRVVLPTGESISPYMLTCAIEDVYAARRFQIVQEDTDKLRIDFVPVEDATEAGRELAARIRDVVGPGVYVEAHPVADIAREASGKCKVVKSELGRACAIRGIAAEAEASGR